MVFGGLLIWVALARQLVFRVLAGCLAFLPAMAFGVAAVNKFYDYYQTWGGMVNDLTGQGASSIPKYAAPGAAYLGMQGGGRPGRLPVPDVGDRGAQPPDP